ncbi:PGPGW domain-containing protein [Carboxydocella sp. ULO1]|uniref:PGPGW domain-containing protein n=1 Tax=Carboxydocella sp. ULO1 TaxID=1926599 RepID=UPI0009AC9712|nr:PGPGW domain-containing protein [Carboxydocella sp. ULO1]GAW29258.1 hypothetical protein ULO1_18280 [Carboxydocella sp. ULO1]
MREKAKKLLRLSLGLIFLILGIAGLFLPVLQGILFLLLALYLLAPDWPWARKWQKKLQARYPGLTNRLRFWKGRLKGIYGK